MTDMKEIRERRKHQRFQIREGVYAALNDGSFKIGQIQNISKGGFAFRYVSNGKKAEGSFTVDLFAVDKAAYLKNIPFKSTSDFYPEVEIPFSTLPLKQCGGLFGELTPTQMSQLDDFIESYIIPEA